MGSIDYLLVKDILAAIAKCPKNAEQKIRMSRKMTKAYCRMVRRMTRTDGFYVSITGYFAIAASIYGTMFLKLLTV